MIQYVFILWIDGKKKVAFGKNLNHAFKQHGGVPKQWNEAFKAGKIKKYTIADYFQKGLYEG